MLEAHAPKATVDKLRSSLATDEQSYYDRQHNTVTSSLELQKKQLELNDQINASYGRRRELVQAQTEIEMRYFAQNKNLTPKQIADMAAEMQMAKQQFDQQTKYMANWKNGVGEAAGDYLDEIQNTAKSTHQIFSNAFKGIEDMFVEFMETGKLNWKSFLQQLAADFLRMEFQKMIMAPFVNGFNAVINPSAAQPNVGGMPGMAGLGGLIGSGVKGIAGMLGLGGSSAGMGILGPTYSIAASTPTIGALSDVLPALAFHTGGVVGSTGAITHNLPSSVFAGAVRYHTGGIAGLAPDEVPAVLRKGERVLTSAQQHAMKSGNASLHFNPQIEINYQAGDGSSSKVDAANMGNQINDAIEAKWKDMMIRESRPGGRLYGAVR
jgi:phage-related minor tail protein